MSVTFSTCWYIFKAKFDTSTYLQWIDNMLSNVNQYNLVIYSDEQSSQCLEKYLHNPRIKLILKPYTEFYNYKYHESWIKNHDNNEELKEYVDWKVNMLWSEKVHFVHETMTNEYFKTDYYGWCDIGYFRCREFQDLPIELLAHWPAAEKIQTLLPTKIYYACINNNKEYIRELMMNIQDKSFCGLPIPPIQENQISIAGGFFITHKQNVEWWRNTYDEKLKLYFEYDYLVKDDQIIIADCVFSNMKYFYLCKEDLHFDNWFLFQRFLL
uniref:Uncharacterized protein n=1 Tax=viral metagenome TaxID=1070528 RepID=A0A6C0KFS8_9ZZZZ